MNVKRLKYLSVLFFFSANILLAQQDLIHNAGFEDKDDNSKPTELGQVSFMEVWVDEFKTETADCDNNSINEPPYIIHSPDWYCNEAGKLYVKEDVGNTGNLTPIEPHSGSCYIGMGPCELIQQQFFNDNQFIEGHKYTLSMYIRIPALPNFTSVSPVKTWSNSGSALLKAFVNQDKIDYSIEANNPCKLCTEGCNKRITDSQPVEIMSKEVNTTNFPPGSWYKISATFDAPVPASPLPKNDWITIELQDPTQCNSLYVLIDDISLSCCKMECSRTDGCFSPILTGQTCFGPEISAEVNKVTALKISNLSNAKWATILVSDYPITNVYNRMVMCENGIDGPIFWDGTDNNGNPVAFHNYKINLTLENECGVEKFDYTIPVEGTYDPTSSICAGVVFEDFVCNEFFLETPAPCCSEQPDINLSNLTIGKPSTAGSLEYIASNNIIIGPNVTIENDANILFRAGNEIIGNPLMEVEIGATVVAEIVPCPAQRLAYPGSSAITNYYETVPDVTTAKLPEVHMLPEIKSAISIVPNPSFNGVFSVSSSQAVSSITVYNLLGETIHHSPFTIHHSPFIDISNQPKGVYFVKLVLSDVEGIQSGENYSVQKIIYQ